MSKVETRPRRHAGDTFPRSLSIRCAGIQNQTAGVALEISCHGRAKIYDAFPFRVGEKGVAGRLAREKETTMQLVFSIWKDVEKYLKKSNVREVNN